MIRWRLAWRGRAWLWPLIAALLLAVAALLFGDHPPMAAILSVLL